MDGPFVILKHSGSPKPCMADLRRWKLGISSLGLDSVVS